MRAFATVGSTRFDALVRAVLSPDVLAALRNRGYTELAVQCGDSALDADVLAAAGAGAAAWTLERDGVRVEVWRFRPSLADEFARADLVVSHAGSGTILDVLRMDDGKGRTGRPLVVVPNPTLLDNHQAELADALSKLGYLVASTVADLEQTLRNFDEAAIVPFPAFDGSRFRELLDEEMGFT